MGEIPWGDGPYQARIRWDAHDEHPDVGDLRFEVPDGSLRPGRDFAIIPVTRGDSNEATTRIGTNVWHVDEGEGTVTVSPSIHFHGHFHSPNPVTFNLVDDFPEDDDL